MGKLSWDRIKGEGFYLQINGEGAADVTRRLRGSRPPAERC
jgi:hypothetical protein